MKRVWYILFQLLMAASFAFVVWCLLSSLWEQSLNDYEVQDIKLEQADH